MKTVTLPPKPCKACGNKDDTKCAVQCCDCGETLCNQAEYPDYAQWRCPACFGDIAGRAVTA
ncbi:hypothetical protein LCGC14_1315550 [marine sediment metagenome]|uniref:Uncharacterized protein n=1 Tax=marine sediment metagenome TaxID=412755 RepID=A0A0F9KLM2_9ZZZZ